MLGVELQTLLNVIFVLTMYKKHLIIYLFLVLILFAYAICLRAVGIHGPFKHLKQTMSKWRVLILLLNLNHFTKQYRCLSFEKYEKEGMQSTMKKKRPEMG